MYTSDSIQQYLVPFTDKLTWRTDTVWLFQDGWQDESRLAATALEMVTVEMPVTHVPPKRGIILPVMGV